LRTPKDWPGSLAIPCPIVGKGDEELELKLGNLKMEGRQLLTTFSKSTWALRRTLAPYTSVPY